MSNKFTQFVYDYIVKNHDDQSITKMRYIHNLQLKLKFSKFDFFVGDYIDMIQFFIKIFEHYIKKTNDDKKIELISDFEFLVRQQFHHIYHNQANTTASKSCLCEPLIKNTPFFASFPDLMLDFEQFAKSNGFSIGMNWKNFFVELTQTNKSVVCDFAILLAKYDLSKLGSLLTELFSSKKPLIDKPDNWLAMIRNICKPVVNQRKKWNYCFPHDYVQLVSAHIPETLGTIEQITFFGCGHIIKPLIVANFPSMKIFSDIGKIRFKKMIKKFMNYRFGDDIIRDNMFMYDIATYLLEVTENNNIVESKEFNENILSVHNIISKICDLADDEFQKKCIESKKLLLSKTEVNLLNFYFDGMLNLVKENISKVIGAYGRNIHSGNNLLENFLKECEYVDFINVWLSNPPKNSEYTQDEIDYITQLCFDKRVIPYVLMIFFKSKIIIEINKIKIEQLKKKYKIQDM